MLDYDMIASTNFIPFVYIPNARREPTLPPPQRDGEATLGNIHIDYLKQKLEHQTASTYPSTTAPTTPSGAPRRPGDRPLHRRRGHQDRCAGRGQYGGQAGIQADPCYHEWCDTVFNLSEYGLDEFTDVLAHAILSFAGVGTDAVEIPVRADD